MILDRDYWYKGKERATVEATFHLNGPSDARPENMPEYSNAVGHIGLVNEQR